jgi:hypothetical protein
MEEILGSWKNDNGPYYVEHQSDARKFKNMDSVPFILEYNCLDIYEISINATELRKFVRQYTCPKDIGIDADHGNLELITSPLNSKEAFIITSGYTCKGICKRWVNHYTYSQGPKDLVTSTVELFEKDPKAYKLYLNELCGWESVLFSEGIKRKSEEQVEFDFTENLSSLEILKLNGDFNLVPSNLYPSTTGSKFVRKKWPFKRKFQHYVIEL